MTKYILFNSNVNYSIFFVCFLMVLETVFTTSITMETLFTLETFLTSENISIVTENFSITLETFFTRATRATKIHAWCKWITHGKTFHYSGN